MVLGRLFGRRRPEPPAAEPAPAASPPPPEPEPPRPATTIVVVDDDADVRELMVMALTRGGFDVVGEAADAADAVRAVGDTQPDLVLLDLHMPDASGLEVMPDLRAASRRSRVVILSAISATFMVEAAIEAGAVGFIEKGVTTRTILKHLEHVATARSVRLVRPFPLSRDFG